MIDESSEFPFAKVARNAEPKRSCGTSLRDGDERPSGSKVRPLSGYASLDNGPVHHSGRPKVVAGTPMRLRSETSRLL